ncbi:unnamed protein product [Amoebophrya sp. A25]|nr:unnamed protein product [Amoebophrya sp. A25]|eukprot:GSA25T00024816001.1
MISREIQDRNKQKLGIRVPSRCNYSGTSREEKLTTGLFVALCRHDSGANIIFRQSCTWTMGSPLRSSFSGCLWDLARSRLFSRRS